MTGSQDGLERLIVPERAQIAQRRVRAAKAFARRPLARLRLASRLWQGPKLTPDRKLAIIARDGLACVWCAATERLQVDHVWPWIDGGTHHDENLQTLCQPCNCWKGTRRIVLVRRGQLLYAHRMP